MDRLADRLEPPYYAVIFTSTRTVDDAAGYQQAAARMEELGRMQSGFLGLESARGADGTGITVSYWRTLDDIAAWKRNAEHLVAQSSGRRRWYSWYRLRIARVERDDSFASDDAKRTI